jgi:hypothetical protein
MSAYMVDPDHVDFLVQSAIAGATDSQGWDSRHERHFSYYSHARGLRVYVDPYADEITENAHSETIPPSVLGERLIETNLDSIHARYPDTIEDPENTPGPCKRYWEMPYVFQPIDTGRKVYSLGAGVQVAVQPVASTATVAQQLGHYEYQACEHDGWRDSDGCAFCEAMRCRLLAKLPGAEAAPWGFTREQANGAGDIL